MKNVGREMVRNTAVKVIDTVLRPTSNEYVTSNKDKKIPYTVWFDNGETFSDGVS